MALTVDETDLLNRLQRDLETRKLADDLNLRYYNGKQRVEQLGMAIPPNLRRFLVIANWCGVQVDTIERRQRVRSLVLPGQELDDERLRTIWDASDMDAELSLFNVDRLALGRAFLSVGSNEDDPSLPLMRVESPLEVTCLIDARRRRMTAAARFYSDPPLTSEPEQILPTYATLYLPDVTIWLQRDTHAAQWVEIDRDEHRLGAVPMVVHFNRRRSGSWAGVSEMEPLKPLVDAAARSLTNMQMAQEAHGIPQRYALGVSSGDFIDADGKPLPRWEAYFNAVWMNQNPDVKVGQFTASDLKNFETAVDLYGKQAATVTGFPARYFGQLTSNPPAEGAIRADEAQLVESVERQNTATGTTLGWACALAHRFATGEWVTGNRIRMDWFDPATPTYSQMFDAMTKARASGIISIEGAWDELGWSEQRKEKERRYMDAEQASDPLVNAARALTVPTADAAAGER